MSPASTGTAAPAPLTNEEKRARVEQEPKLNSARSDPAIAEEVGASQPFVGRVRQRLERGGITVITPSDRSRRPPAAAHSRFSGRAGHGKIAFPGLPQSLASGGAVSRPAPRPSGSRAPLKAGLVPENHWRRSLSSERLRSADSASLAHSAASCSHASRSTGLIALSAFHRHSSASRRYLFAAVSDVMAGSSKRGSVLSAR
jgi:hypothetical protein